MKEGDLLPVGCSDQEVVMSDNRVRSFYQSAVRLCGVPVLHAMLR